MSSSSDNLAEAWSHHRSGRRKHAEELYQQILRDQPNNGNARLLYGLFNLQQKKLPDAIEQLQLATALLPTNADAPLNLAKAFHAAGEVAQAAVYYKTACQLAPNSTDAWAGLGSVSLLLNRFADSASAYERSLQIQPNNPQASNNFGLALTELNRLSEAVAAFESAIDANPEYVRAYNNLGNVLLTLGRRDDAHQILQRALQIDPTYAEVHYALGRVCQENLQWDEAKACYQKAIDRNPALINAHNNLGVVHKELGNSTEATAAFRLALQHAPNNISARSNLASILQVTGQLDEALAEYRQVVQYDPNHVSSLRNMAIALQEQGKYAESLLHASRAAELDSSPESRLTYATLAPVIPESVRQIEESRARMEVELKRLVEEQITIDPLIQTVPTTFYLSYQGKNDRPILEMLGQIYRPSEADLPSRMPSPWKRRRIGFISQLFKRHTIGNLWKGMIEKLDRRQFHVTVISLGEHNDPVAHAIRAHADEYLAVPLHFATARQLVAQQQLDILYYTDVGMSPTVNTLASSRLAPVQCVSWGHPSTTGYPAMDYYLSSELLESQQADEHYTERLIRLKTLGLYVEKTEPPQSQKERSNFGLSSENTIYACLQSLFKLHPEFDRLLEKILQQDPRGLVLLPNGIQRNWQRLLQERFRKTIPEVLDRIHFVPRQTHDDYLRLCQLADVLLVPPQFGGGQTSYEAFSLGLPVVTMPTEFLKGRITAGLYRAMGMGDCIAKNEDEYVAFATQLANDPDYRAEFKARLLKNNHLLFEDETAVRELEEFLASVSS